VLLPQHRNAVSLFPTDHRYDAAAVSTTIARPHTVQLAVITAVGLASKKCNSGLCSAPPLDAQLRAGLKSVPYEIEELKVTKAMKLSRLIPIARFALSPVAVRRPIPGNCCFRRLVLDLPSRISIGRTTAVHFFRDGGMDEICYSAAMLILPMVTLAQTGGPRLPPGLDGKFLSLTMQVPGFGGYFFDANGDLNVYLTALGSEAAARAVFSEVARNRPEPWVHPWSRQAEILVRRGDFDFLQLSDWRSRMRKVFGMPGVQFLDIDESRNRVVIGVTEATAEGRVRAVAEDVGVPREGILVEAVAPGHLATTLQENVRPVVGGLEVDSNHVCTLGVNVLYTNLANGVPVGTPGFYTASHCSDVQSSTEGTVFSQGGTRIGYEMWDPPFFIGAPCAGNTQCRYSDVTFVAYDAGVSRHQGYLVQTLYRGFGLGQLGSIDINSTTPEFTVQSTAQYPVQGLYFDKIGRTTGWTAGAVSQTCVDYTFPAYTILCQNKVDAFASGGDSGSPAFQEVNQTSIAFGGIVWFATADGGFVFSYLDQIGQDMGTGVTYGPN
jgi:hypothetical protein